MERVKNFAYKSPIIFFLTSICSLSNLIAAICFAIEVGLHNTWYNWLSTILLFGMFIVPSVTSYFRHNSTGCAKVLWDTLFVVYGLLTLCITSLSIGLAGDPLWGCSNCTYHPGMWGAFLYGIASVTGHAFGWERIKDQQTEYAYVKTREQWEEKNPLQEGLDRSDNGPNDGYLKYKEERKKEYNTEVKWGFWNLVLSNILVLVSLILAIVDAHVGLAWITFFALFSQLVKLIRFMGDTNYYGCTDKNIEYGYEKSLLFVVLNLILVVLLVGQNWYFVGKNIDGDLGVRLSSCIITTIVTILQHYII